MVYTQGR